MTEEKLQKLGTISTYNEEELIKSQSPLLVGVHDRSSKGKMVIWTFLLRRLGLFNIQHPWFENTYELSPALVADLDLFLNMALSHPANEAAGILKPLRSGLRRKMTWGVQGRKIFQHTQLASVFEIDGKQGSATDADRWFAYEAALANGIRAMLRPLEGALSKEGREDLAKLDQIVAHYWQPGDGTKRPPTELPAGYYVDQQAGVVKAAGDAKFAILSPPATKDPRTISRPGKPARQCVAELFATLGLKAPQMQFVMQHLINNEAMWLTVSHSVRPDEMAKNIAALIRAWQPKTDIADRFTKAYKASELKDTLFVDYLVDSRKRYPDVIREMYLQKVQDEKRRELIPGYQIPGIDISTAVEKFFPKLPVPLEKDFQRIVCHDAQFWVSSMDSDMPIGLAEELVARMHFELQLPLPSAQKILADLTQYIQAQHATSTAAARAVAGKTELPTPEGISARTTGGGRYRTRQKISAGAAAKPDVKQIERGEGVPAIDKEVEAAVLEATSKADQLAAEARKRLAVWEAQRRGVLAEERKADSAAAVSLSAQSAADFEGHESGAPVFPATNAPGAGAGAADAKHTLSGQSAPKAPPQSRQLLSSHATVADNKSAQKSPEATPMADRLIEDARKRLAAAEVQGEGVQAEERKADSATAVLLSAQSAADSEENEPGAPVFPATNAPGAADVKHTLSSQSAPKAPPKSIQFLSGHAITADNKSTQKSPAELELEQAKKELALAQRELQQLSEALTDPSQKVDPTLDAEELLPKAIMKVEMKCIAVINADAQLAKEKAPLASIY